MIEEAEELQQEQPQVKWTNRSSHQNQNHIRDQIQAMDDDTSFSSDLLLTKPSAAGPGELQQVIQEQIQEDYKENVAND